MGRYAAPVDLQELAAAYLASDVERYYDDVERLLADEPEEAWAFVDAAIEAAETTGDLGRVGAGPLEDLMSMWGGAFADRLIDRVRSDARWAYAAWIVRGAAGAEEAQATIPSIWPDLEVAASARLARPAL